MCKGFIYLVVLFIFSNRLFGQIHPAEDSRLHHRIIGFSFQEEKNAYNYIIEIAEGRRMSDSDFDTHILLNAQGRNNKIIAEVPSFDAEYTWRVTTKDRKGRGVKGPLYHFYVSAIPWAVVGPTRLNVLSPAEKYTDAYVFLDCTRTLYDMKGNPVWFIPEKLMKTYNEESVSDLKPTDAGTITFITGSGAPMEIDYDGNILWQLPKEVSKKESHLHHEFTRLENGHYMTLGNEFPHWLLPGKRNDIQLADSTDSAGVYQRMEFGTLIEFDHEGNVVWKWKSSSYFEHSDIRKRLKEDNTYDAHVHLNSFFFDEKEQCIYLSFRDINRILRISYPDGTVLNEYGKKYSDGATDLLNGLFCYQHSCRITANGDVMVFNNNLCNSTFPKLVIMEQPAKAAVGNLKVKWEYDCKEQNIKIKTGDMPRFGKGGNILELPGDAIFASLNMPYNLVFIVSKDKKMIWSALPERLQGKEIGWEPIGTYRASIVYKQGILEKMIWRR